MLTNLVVLLTAGLTITNMAGITTVSWLALYGMFFVTAIVGGFVHIANEQNKKKELLANRIQDHAREIEEYLAAREAQQEKGDKNIH